MYRGTVALDIGVEWSQAQALAVFFEQIPDSFLLLMNLQNKFVDHLFRNL